MTKRDTQASEYVAETDVASMCRELADRPIAESLRLAAAEIERLKAAPGLSPQEEAALSYTARWCLNRKHAKTLNGLLARMSS